MEDVKKYRKGTLQLKLRNPVEEPAISNFNTAPNVDGEEEIISSSQGLHPSTPVKTKKIHSNLTPPLHLQGAKKARKRFPNYTSLNAGKGTVIRDLTQLTKL